MFFVLELVQSLLFNNLAIQRKLKVEVDAQNLKHCRKHDKVDAHNLIHYRKHDKVDAHMRKIYG